MDEARFVFEWDLTKANENIAKRRLPFELAEFILADPNAVHEVDDREDYGEIRRIAYGQVGRLHLRLVYTIRGKNNEVCRVITLYQVHNEEWSKHYEKDY